VNQDKPDKENCEDEFDKAATHIIAYLDIRKSFGTFCRSLGKRY
jgi:hypothetical protein